ncbi:hypothetical protein ABT364_19825 [Massilia sp. SR12]
MSAAPANPSSLPATARGTILRDTNAGSGLIAVNGAKKPFTLEQHWIGSDAPQVQMQVDVTFDEQGEISSVVPVNVAAEDLEKYKALARKAVDDGAPVVLAYIDRIGKPVVGAMLAIFVSWLWLPAISVTIMAGMQQSATLFDVLRLANMGASLESFGQLGGGSSGLYGVLCVLAMAAPLLPVFSRHKYAALGYCAPLAFLVLTGLGIYLKMHQMASAARDSMRAFGGRGMEDVADAMMQRVSQVVSLGFGTYLSLAAAAYLAYLGVRALKQKR